MIEYEAGRELDALIAEKVMGWTQITTLTGEAGELVGAPPEFPKQRNWLVARYSQDIGAAWEVVEKLQDAHDIELYRLNNIEAIEGPTVWSCRIGDLVSGAFVARYAAPTAPLAICLASLKALDREQVT